LASAQEEEGKCQDHHCTLFGRVGLVLLHSNQESPGQEVEMVNYMKQQSMACFEHNIEKESNLQMQIQEYYIEEDNTFGEH